MIEQYNAQFSQGELTLKTIYPKKRNDRLIWEGFDKGYIDADTLLKKYFHREFDFQFVEDNLKPDYIPVETFLSILLQTDVNDITDMVRQKKFKEPLLPRDMPRYADIYISLFALPYLLRAKFTPLTYKQITLEINKRCNFRRRLPQRDVANCIFLAEIFNLVKVKRGINASCSTSLITLSVLGRVYNKLSILDKIKILKRLVYYVAPIQRIYQTTGDMQIITFASKLLPDIRELDPTKALNIWSVEKKKLEPIYHGFLREKLTGWE